MCVRHISIAHRMACVQPTSCALHIDIEMHILEGAPTHRGEEGVAGLELLHTRPAHLRGAGTIDGWVFG